MTRREQREHLFRMVFCKDFHETGEAEEQFNMYFERLETPDENDVTEIREKFERLCAKEGEIDSVIAEATQGWQIKRIGKAELSIMRVAVYEVLFDESVPAKVAVNEAVELAKKYCGDAAPSFVNGVLAKIVKE